MNNDITPEKALELIKPLKPSEFIEMAYSDGKGKCCVMGHITRLTSDNPTDYSIKNCDAMKAERLKELRQKANRILKDESFYSISKLAIINNGGNSNYPQKTIKGRVVAALKDIIKAERS